MAAASASSSDTSPKYLLFNTGTITATADHHHTGAETSTNQYHAAGSASGVAGNGEQDRGETPQTGAPHVADSGGTNEEDAEIVELATKAASVAKTLIAKEEVKNPDFKRKQKEQEKRESMIRKLTQEWKNIIGKYEATGHFPAKGKLRKLAKKGIPSAVRHQVWPLLIENKMQITPELFHIFRERARMSRESIENGIEKMRVNSSNTTDCSRQEHNDDDSVTANSEGSSRSEGHSDEIPLLGREQSLRLIKTDLDRTFPKLAFFKEEGPLHEPLRDILEAFVSYRPDVGYVQGMSFLAAVLLLNIGDTATCFQCLANMLSNSTYFDFYRLDMTKMREHLQVFDYYLCYYIPVLHSHLANEGVILESSLLGWILTLFSNVLPLEIATRVWDFYFCSSETVVWTICLSILRILEPYALQTDVGGIMTMLREPPREIKWDGLFDIVESVEIDEAKFNDLLHKVKKGHTLKPPAPKISRFKYAAYAPEAAAIAADKAKILRSTVMDNAVRYHDRGSSGKSSELPGNSFGMVAVALKDRFHSFRDRLTKRDRQGSAASAQSGGATDGVGTQEDDDDDERSAAPE